MLWSSVCLLWLTICIAESASTTNSLKKCCLNNVIPKKGHMCENGSSISLECADSSYLILHENEDYEMRDGLLVIIHPFIEIQYVVPTRECVSLRHKPLLFIKHISFKVKVLLSLDKELLPNL